MPFGLFPNTEIYEYVIILDHLHGLLVINSGEWWYIQKIADLEELKGNYLEP